MVGPYNSLSTGQGFGPAVGANTYIDIVGESEAEEAFGVVSLDFEVRLVNFAVVAIDHVLDQCFDREIVVFELLDGIVCERRDVASDALDKQGIAFLSILSAPK